ncbi:MAG: peptidoglycan DD-metalloendopeptidase family protein [Cellulosilyticum sp.]|nr:peptidoglycan DD-metalloendopeptidase family protein [Cellulosilyticum sp.]
MKKIGNLLKQYGFYIATAFVCVGALLAIFLMPNNQGNVKNEANPYAKNEYTDAKDLTQGVEEDILEEDDLDTTDGLNTEISDQVNENTEATVDESASLTPDVANTEETAENVATEENTSESAAATDETTAEEVVEPETFESTTASTNGEPFFAEGDTFAWPVEGSVVVPYTDESTKHWFSESLNQTMRTFGICISAEEGTEVKAVAKGTVVEIVDDSSTYLESGMPYVGKLMVIDHGNGYVSLYGFQRGEVNEQLVGQVVNAGDVLGSIGSPQGAFIGIGDNIYLQVMHNDEVVNPLNYLDLGNQDVKADSVDLGFAE